jgi:hypothetical protein
VWLMPAQALRPVAMTMMPMLLIVVFMVWLLSG